jgi:hypothetical protein
MSNLPFRVSSGRFYRKMVTVKHGVRKFGITGPGWYGPASGHSIPWFSQMPLMPSNPYSREVLAQSDREEGVRTVRYGSEANLGSAWKFLNSDSRIWIQMHSHSVWYDSRIRTMSGSGSVAFCISMNFLWIRTWGSGSGFASHPTALEKIIHDFLKENRIRAYL